MITVATLLRGDYSLTNRLINNFINQKKDTPDITLVAAVNNVVDKEMIESNGGKSVLVDKYNGTNDSIRQKFIGELWRLVLRDVDTEKTLIWDDDIIPTSKSLQTLVETMPSDASGIVSVYPFRDSDLACLFFSPWTPTKISSINKSVFRVAGGGMGYSLWNTEMLKKCMPLVPHERKGLDFDLAVKLSEQDSNKYIYCNGSVISGHLDA